MNKMVMVMNHGLVNVKVKDGKVFWTDAVLERFDGERWGVWMYDDEDEFHGVAPIPNGVNPEDLRDVMEGVVLEAIDAPSGASWMEVY